MRAGVALAAALTGPAAAGELIWPPAGADRRFLLAEEAAAFRAVGRLNIGEDRFCTATLISEREVLTAAHCLHHPRTGKPVPLSALRFAPGYRPDLGLGEWSVTRIAAPPDFEFMKAPRAEDLHADIALLELGEPVDAVLAPPFDVGPLAAEDAAVTIVSYARDRPEAPSISEECPPLGAVGTLLVINCPIERGVSGAPVFVTEGFETRLVAVVSSMGELPDGEAFALSVLTAPWIDALRALLAAAPTDADPAPR